MELLNLDELAVGVKRQVQVKGKTYDLAERQLGQMIAAIQRVKEFEKAESAGSDLDMSEAVALNLIESAQQLLPDCPKKVLEACSMKQLSALLEFANVEDSEIIEETNEKLGKGSEDKEVALAEGK